MSVTRKLLAKSNEGREELHLDRTKEDLSEKKKKKFWLSFSLNVYIILFS